VLVALARARNYRFMLVLAAVALFSLTRPDRLFRAPDGLKLASVSGMVVTSDGARFKTDFRGLLLVYEIYLLNCYELLEGFRVEKGARVIDVGSNVGFFTVKAALEAGPEGLVLSVEPHPAAFGMLQENIALNGLKNVTAVRAALGSSETERRLFFSRGSTVGTFYESVLHSQDRSSARVDVVTLDSLARERGLGTIDLVKIDVEGAEMDVLRGSAGLLSGGLIRRVVVETHSEELLKDTRRLLQEHGFRSVTIDVLPFTSVWQTFPTLFAVKY
jgi:FkbM family methyltransferase